MDSPAQRFLVLVVVVLVLETFSLRRSRIFRDSLSGVQHL